jgi:ABC-2 type transport system ATP-binding protein
MSLLDLDDITHHYGPLKALDGVSLRVEPGSIGLIGQNGAGKSTLLKILLGLIIPTSGGGTVLGFDLMRQTHELRWRVGFMPEAESFLPGVKGVDLVALAGELSGMPRLQARRRAHEVLSYLGLEEVRYRKCEDYSVGMKQRLKLAAALVHDPQLLLLDEPTAGLDPDGRDAMLRLLKAIAERHGKSLILSTHLLGDIERVCQQVIIVDRGRVLGVGPIRELCQSQPGRYRLRWRGDGTEFLNRLRADGATVLPSPRTDQAVVDVPADWATRRFFERSVDCELVLREVIPEEEDLQQVYQRLVMPASAV